jgi:hypothetical protein
MKHDRKMVEQMKPKAKKKAYSEWKKDKRLGYIFKNEHQKEPKYEIQINGMKKMSFNNFRDMEVHLADFDLVPLCR